MKTKKVLFFAICLVASIIMSSCHSSVPCPVYAQGEEVEENITSD